MKKQKFRSTYEELKSKYPYEFRDAVGYKGGRIAGTGLKEPEVAEEYALEMLDITRNLLGGNYKIIECLARFIDDEFCSYGEMELVRNSEQISEGIEKWKDYYLKGPGIRKRTVCKDLIDDCVLHMKLEHIKGKPHLIGTSYCIINKKSRGNKGKILKNEFELSSCHSVGVWSRKKLTNNKRKKSI